MTPEDKRRQDLLPATPAEIKEAYPMTCSECKHEQMVNPSMMMAVFGLNSGHGHCLGCDASLHLWIEGEEIKSESTEIWRIRVAGER